MKKVQRGSTKALLEITTVFSRVKEYKVTLQKYIYIVAMNTQGLKLKM